jgi:hypothetical protein
VAKENFNEYDFVSFWISSHGSEGISEDSLLQHPLLPCILEYEEESIRAYGAGESTLEELLICLIGDEGVQCTHNFGNLGIRRREILEEWIASWGPLSDKQKFRFINHKYMHALVDTHPALISWAISRTPKLIEVYEICWPRFGFNEYLTNDESDESNSIDLHLDSTEFTYEPNFDEMTSEEFLYMNSIEGDLY